LHADPAGRRDQARSEQADVEAQSARALVDLAFLRRQQVEEQGT